MTATSMYSYQYRDTELTFTVKPYSTHHIWEYEAYLYYIDETQTDLYKKHTTTGTETKVADLPRKGQMGFLDGDILHLVLCDNPGNVFSHYEYDLSKGDAETDVGDIAGLDAGTVYAFDIFKHSTDFYVVSSYLDGGTKKTSIFTVTGAPFVIKKLLDSGNENLSTIIPFVINGNDIYTFIYSQARREASYSVEALGPNDDAVGICWDGTNFYLTDSDIPDIASVFKYNSDFTVLVATLDLDALSGGLNDEAGRGICWDGSSFFVIDNDSFVYEYNAAFVYQGRFALHAGNTDAWGICWDGSNFFVVDLSGVSVYKYNAAGVHQATYGIGALGGNDSPRGITWDGTYFYVSDSDNSIYKYPSDFSSLIESFSVGSIGNDFPSGLDWIGDYCWTTRGNWGRIYKYRFKPLSELEYNFTSGDVTINYIINTSTISSTLNRQGIVFDGVDTLYYIAQKNADSKYYLHSYVISTTTDTDLGEFNLALMLDRNVNGSGDPFNSEKAFHITDGKIYQFFSRGTFMIQPVSSYFKANGIIPNVITDRYVIDSNGKLYKYCMKGVRGWLD